jgi:GTPase
MKSGFVNIFGKPNAGKSTLLNALLGEKLAIVSHKVQTTRHRIKGILNSPEYQIIISDTPGIIEPKYKLHEKMMGAVRSSLEDADLGLLITDINEPTDESHHIFTALKLKAPCIVVLNKADKTTPEQEAAIITFYKQQPYCKQVAVISALKKTGIEQLLQLILTYLPEGMPFYGEDELSDLPTKFFVGEMVREKIFQFLGDEIPYHSTVLVQEFKEKSTLIKIRAEIIVQRDTQKVILIGQGGSMIKKIGSAARIDIEAFLDNKIFLELFVKVRPKWRDNELHLREYGY